MDTDKYRALIYAIDTGSLTAAAEKLGYTPSGISRSVATVEEQLGFPLLTRAKSGVTPTEDCEQVLPIIRNILRIQDQLQQTADRICSLETGSVTVGTAYPIYDQIISKKIVAFRRLHPKISIRLIEGTSSELSHKLSLHELDFCIISQRENMPVFHPLCRDSICAWVPSFHPAVAGGIYQVRNLWSDDYIELYPDLETDNSLFLQKNQLYPNVCAATSDTYAAYAMVEAGLGVVLINTLLSQRWKGEVAALPLDRSSDFEIGIAAKAEEDSSPAAKEFLEFILPDLKNARI
ncbi:MAG: LysR family transcriptional regulator [Anaerolineaceae bacterium]|nr:LysR family transcriptional regulator [Anaerolineaceae bacterium]